MSLRNLKHLQIKQRGCYLVDMNPRRKSKPGKVRPVIVIQSSDTLQAGSPGVVIVPLTTKLRESNILRARVTPTPFLSIEQPSDILLDQVHTIDRSLFLEELGMIETTDWEKIQRGIQFLLK